VPEVDASRVLEVARAVREVVQDVAIERLIVVEGVAEHEWEHPSSAFGTFSPRARGEKADNRVARSADERSLEHTRRIHLSLTHARTRALLDLASFDLDDIERVAAVLARTDGIERAAPPRLRVAANVTAALLPSLVGIAPPNVRLVQTAGGVDGYGAPIVEATGAWPNSYRPSYRVRPVRMPLQLRLECDVADIDRDLPVAAALIAPVSIADGLLVMRVLIDDGERPFPSIVRIARIAAVSAPTVSYPYGGGSFGAEMML
jgi:hypothetical protein